MVGAYSLGEPLAGSACRHSSQDSIVYVSGDSMECVTSMAGVRFPQLALAVAAPACNIAFPRIATHYAVVNNHTKQHILYTAINTIILRSIIAKQCVRTLSCV